MGERTMSNILDRDRAYAIYSQSGYSCGSILQAIKYFDKGKFWNSLSTHQRSKAFKKMIGYSQLESCANMYGSADVYLARFELDGKEECLASIFSNSEKYIGLLQNHAEYLKQFCFKHVRKTPLSSYTREYIIMPIDCYARAMKEEGLIDEVVCEIIESFVRTYEVKSFGERFFELEEFVDNAIQENSLHSYPIAHPIKLVAFFRNDIFEVVNEFFYALSRSPEYLSDREEFDTYQRLTFFRGEDLLGDFCYFGIKDLQERIKRGEMRRFVDFMECNKELIERTYITHCKEDEEMSEDTRVCIAHNLLFLQMRRICFGEGDDICA